MAGNKRLPKGIYQTSSGLYRAEFTLDGERFTFSSRDLEELKKMIVNKKADIVNGTYHREKPVTVDAWFNTWLTTYRTDLKESTASTYRQVYKNCIADEIGKKRIGEIRGDALQKLVNGLVTKGYGYTRVNLTMTILSGMFSKAFTLKYINVNPMAKGSVVMPPKKQFPKRKYKAGERTKAMTPEQKDLFLEYARGSVYEDAYIFALNTGCRLGEITGLRWQDVDFTNRKLHITHTLNYIRGKGRILDTTKSDCSERVIPMNSTVYDMLRRIRKQQMEYKSDMGDFWKEEEGLENIVFTYPIGGAFWESCIRVDMKSISERIRKDGHDFERITPHSFRHTFATLGLKNGIPAKVMQKLLGHANLSITMDIYADVLEEDRTEAMELIGKVM